MTAIGERQRAARGGSRLDAGALVVFRVAAVLRWAVRQAGVEAIRRQWPGTGDVSPPCAVSPA